MNKYKIYFPSGLRKKEIKRLTNQLWKLIPMRESNEDWRKQLDTVILEIVGLYEIFMSVQFLQLLSKLEGLRTVETTFEFYRKTVFETISLVQELNDSGIWL